MANEIKTKYGTIQTLTITLASLASSTAGVGRQGTIVDNSTDLWTAILLYCRVRVGTTPTANRSIRIYGIRDSNNGGAYLTDNAGASDAAWTVTNAPLLGAMAVPVNTSNLYYYTECIFWMPGTHWSIGIVHDTVAALNATGGDHLIQWRGFNPEVQ